jgi:hypothetical protein
LVAATKQREVLQRHLMVQAASDAETISLRVVVDQNGVHGTLGIAAATNTPGAHVPAVTWTDAAGNLWLFGGDGYDSAGDVDELSDVWKCSAGEWTWIGGSDVASQQGTYGTLGSAASGNTPGGRSQTVGWTDAAGHFWLFGGLGYDAVGTLGQLNDLWMYGP